MTFRSLNPATGQLLESFPELDAAALQRCLERSEQAAARWRATPFVERSAALRRVAALLRGDKREHAERMAREMGKPRAQGEAEVEKCAWACEWYAEHAERFLAEQPAPSDAARSYLRFDPLGPILAIMPWNFPYWQVWRFAAPALMAGNVVLVKHAENVPACALALAELCRSAELPEGTYENLFVSHETVAALIDGPVVRAVTLTGSDRAGAAVAARAGAALKKSVLELGGSDPFIVLDDADVEAAATAAARTRTLNSGQSCIAAKRFVVVEAVADRFVEALRTRLEALRVGDPLDPATDVGPLARQDLVEQLDAQVQRSLAEGAKRLCGGRRLEGAGFFYAPTLLDGVTPEMTAGREETFGPVAAVLRVRSEDEALRTANATRYGLGASVWSRSMPRAEALAAHLEAGCVFVNGIVKSDPRLPFGGIKRSGYGRELGELGIREFVNVKTVWTAPG